MSSSFRHRRCSYGFQHLHQLIQFRGAEQAIRPVRRDVGERGFIEPIRGDNSVLREGIDDGPLGKYSELNDLDSELRARDVLRTCSPAVVGAGGSNLMAVSLAILRVAQHLAEQGRVDGAERESQARILCPFVRVRDLYP